MSFTSFLLNNQVDCNYKNGGGGGGGGYSSLEIILILLLLQILPVCVYSGSPTYVKVQFWGFMHKAKSSKARKPLKLPLHATPVWSGPWPLLCLMGSGNVVRRSWDAPRAPCMAFPEPSKQGGGLRKHKMPQKEILSPLPCLVGSGKVARDLRQPLLAPLPFSISPPST